MYVYEVHGYDLQPDYEEYTCGIFSSEEEAVCYLEEELGAKEIECSLSNTFVYGPRVDLPREWRAYEEWEDLDGDPALTETQGYMIVEWELNRGFE